MSRVIDILNKIIAVSDYNGEQLSRSDHILKALANYEKYDENAIGRYEALLLCILNGNSYS